MRTAFVTGGSGFVGRHLIRRLAEAGWAVRGLARSKAAAEAVQAAGAEAVPGDLENGPALLAGLAGADVVFHAAALFTLWGRPAAFERANVEGTRHLLSAARQVGVPRLVQIGAAAVVMGERRPMRQVTEGAPLAEPTWAPYIASKARAQRLVLDANTPEFLTSVLLPPMIWGPGMPMLDGIVADVRGGRFAWPGGGRQLMSTAHVDNVTACAILAGERSPGGRDYFVTDGENHTLREVMTALLATRGVRPRAPSVPMSLAWPSARLMEGLWSSLSLRGEPPLTRSMLRMVGYDFTLDDRRARQELGYEPVVSWEDGVSAMSRTTDRTAPARPAATRTESRNVHIS